MLLKLVTLGSRQRVSVAPTRGISQMDIEEPSYLSFKVDLAPLDARPKERTLAHIEYCSNQS